VDRWITGTQTSVFRVANPLVVDLGFGASPVTTVELARRLRLARTDIRVVGLELDPVRVATAVASAEPPWLEFQQGGFEYASLRPILVRAMNVLRQYDEPAALRAWGTMLAGLAEHGLLIEGTCDELGRLGSWIALDSRGPRSLTFAAALSTLDTPLTFAERLPKALIHHNIEGQPVHKFLRAFGSAWDSAAPLASFGPRQRWIRAVELLSTDWPVIGGHNRWRLGEVTVAWSAVETPGSPASN
jgi:hypothetical protein